MRLEFRFTWLAAVASAGVFAFACSNSKPAGTGPSVTLSGPVSQPITAAAGGTVKDPTGNASLAIPAGSLSGDVTITLSETAAESGTVGAVYNFGPDGTQFSKPASLALQLPAGTSVPSGQTPTLATYDGSKWAPIAGSTFANGAVTGPIAHFSKYTIVLINGQVQVTNSCSDTVASFTACGGDVTGTWSLTDLCDSSGSAGADPTDGGCPGASLTASVTPSGSITFNSDGTYSQSALSLAVSENLVIPTSCLGAVKTCDPSSLGFKGSDGGSPGTCSTSGANCDCTQSTTQAPSAAKTGTYKAAGNALTTDNGTGSPYCVKNGTLYVQQRGSLTNKTGTSVLVAKKQ